MCGLAFGFSTLYGAYGDLTCGHVRGALYSITLSHALVGRQLGVNLYGRAAS